jgi:DNA polymerase III alpha subunit (gram-positive type)
MQDVRMKEIRRASNYVVYDLETTGLVSYMDDIIQMSAFKFSDKAKLTSVLNTYVATDIAIPELVSELTGITQDMLPEYPDQVEAIKMLQAFLEDVPCVIGYNNFGFDDKFVKYKGLDLSQVEVQDLYIMMQRWNPVKEDLGAMSLETYKNYLGIEAASHTSDADVEVTNMLYNYWFDNRPTPTTGDIIESYNAVLDVTHHNIYSKLKLFAGSIVDVHVLDNDKDEAFAPNYMLVNHSYKGDFVIFVDDLKAARLDIK